MHFHLPRSAAPGRAAPEPAAASGERPIAAPGRTPASRGVAVLALWAALLAGCTDPYGRVDYGRTALLGVGVGGAAALAAGALSDRRRPDYGHPGGYGGHGYGPPRGYRRAGAYGYTAPPRHHGGGHGYGHRGPRGHYGGW